MSAYVAAAGGGVRGREGRLHGDQAPARSRRRLLRRRDADGHGGQVVGHGDEGLDRRSAVQGAREARAGRAREGRAIRSGTAGSARGSRASSTRVRERSIRTITAGRSRPSAAAASGCSSSASRRAFTARIAPAGRSPAITPASSCIARCMRFGFATARRVASRDDGLRLIDCRITNSVKCLPPGNKPLPAEVRSCNRYPASARLCVLRPRRRGRCAGVDRARRGAARLRPAACRRTGSRTARSTRCPVARGCSIPITAAATTRRPAG